MDVKEEMSEYKHKLGIEEKPNLDEVGLEPLIDMAFAADLCGMTYGQIKSFLSRNKWRFPPRYRVLRYKDVGGFKRTCKIRVLYPYEIKLLREITLRGPGSTIHNRADLDRYLASEEGQDAHERCRKPSISPRAVAARVAGESRILTGGTAKIAGSDLGPVVQGVEGEGDKDSLSSRGDDREDTYD